MIRFSAVTKDFGGAYPALSDINFQVEKGEFVFLTGPSGSGKSTLLKLITKEYLPSQGDIEFDSVPLSQIRGSKVHHHRRRIGVVFQDYRLLPELNVWENIALPLEILGRPREEIEERVTDLLELVQLSDKPYAFPAQLSGGESQRVGIARALATAPGVLLADEPTGNLDPQNTLIIAKLFHKIHELGTTILFATHDLSILNALSARRIHLDKGKLVSDAEHKAGKEVIEFSPKLHDAEKASKKDLDPTPEKPIAEDKEEKPADEKPAELNVTEKDVQPQAPSVPDQKPKKGFRFPKLGLPSWRKKQSLEPQQHEIPEEVRTNNDPSEAKHVELEDEMMDMLIHVEDLDSSKKKKL
jgi:cell division transport system ATP-binding protein